MAKYLLPLLLVLSACHKDEPAAPTAEQSGQLNDAENLLDSLAQNQGGAENRAGSQNEEGPEANASGPSNSSD